MSYQKQEPDKPLFGNLIWSKPENKTQAGKLLIIGGKAGEFHNVSSCFNFAGQAGAGTIRTLLPDSLSQIAKMIPGVELAPSNKSGGFAKNALASFFDLSEWADHVLLAGDFGKNSETTVILDGFILRGQKPMTLTQNSLESIGLSLEQVLRLPVNLVIDRDVLRKIGMRLKIHTPITTITTFDQMKEIIEHISSKSKSGLIIQDEEHIWACSDGEVVSTKAKRADEGALASYAAVWSMQNPKKPFEALSCAVYETISYQNPA